MSLFYRSTPHARLLVAGVSLLVLLCLALSACGAAPTASGPSTGTTAQPNLPPVGGGGGGGGDLPTETPTPVPPSISISPTQIGPAWPGSETTCQLDTRNTYDHVCLLTLSNPTSVTHQWSVTSAARGIIFTMYSGLPTGSLAAQSQAYLSFAAPYPNFTGSFVFVDLTTGHSITVSIQW